MSSINNAVDFIYGNISSMEFGVGLASSIGSTNRSGNIETRDIITSNSSSSTIFGFHGVKYSSPNTFDLIIYNIDGTTIDEDKERQLKKWLMSSTFKWLSIDQDTLNGVSYFCIGTKFELIDIGSNTCGALISFQMDSVGAWTDLTTKSYTTSNNTLNFKLYIDTDYDDEIVRPIATITSISGGNISIKNVTRNETITINGCLLGEVIILDGSSGKISTSANRVLSSYWNKKYIKFQDGYNEILLTGNFSLKLQYRKQVRIGG